MKQKLKVLLVDDDETANFINKTIINKSGLFEEVQTFLKAKECLQFISEDTNFNPEGKIIFLDINMPEMDGWEFLEHFNELPEKFSQNIKVFILSSSQNPDDIEKADSNNLIQEFVNKPLSVDFLKSKFNQSEKG